MAKSSGKSSKHKSKSNAAAQHGSKRDAGSKPAFQFKDNRSGTAAQRKLQDLTDQSPQVTQAKAYQNMADHKSQEQNPLQLQAMNTGDPIQLKTEISNTGQNYTHGASTTVVGKLMESWLDPTDRTPGQSANLNASQDQLMTDIRANWGITGGDVVKGHLLNDNLGGSALSDNLYPITRGANGAHLSYVENVAKTHNWSKNNPIYYKVNVNANPNMKTATAKFETEIRAWDSSKPKDKSGKVLGQMTIESDLNSVRAREVSNPADPTAVPDTTKNPKKPAGFVGPYKTVGTLPADQKKKRDDDMA